MLFSTHEFLFYFLPLCLVGFYLFKKTSFEFSMFLLVIASLFFYSYFKFAYLLLILGSIIFNYSIAYKIGPKKPRSKIWLTMGVAFNLGLLMVFKYTDFFILNVNSLFGASMPLQHILLPIGISFFTFQQIAYLVDVHKEKVEKPGLINYSLFVSFFPQLIAGPIVHFKNVIPQFLANKLEFPSREKIQTGISFFAIGLFKKVFFADQIGLIADKYFDVVLNDGWLHGFYAFIGVLAYTLQIYLDFSAYSEMAIGLGLFFGIRLPDNFKNPYYSANIVDFWRTWHITLSTFLKDYLYIPLGGNRKGKTRRNINLMITMLLGGIWHGAGWNFFIWGGLHGLYLLINHNYRRLLPVHVPKLLGCIITISVVMFAWIFFRAQSMEHAFKYIVQFGHMDDPINYAIWHILRDGFTMALLLGASLWVLFERWLCRYRNKWLYGCFIGVVGFIAIIYMGEENAFIYFNF